MKRLVRSVLGAGLAACVIGAAACADGSGDSPTTPTTDTTSTTSTTGTPVAFTSTWSAAGPYHINDVGGTGSPNERFDYFVTTEGIDTALARKHIEISSIVVSGTGISQSDFATFDVEVHLDGTTIGLPAGQATTSSTNPDRGITRSARSQFKVVPLRNTAYNAALTATVDMGFRVQFTAPNTATTSPTLYNVKSLPATALDLTDGLHMQLFLWTGSGFTDALFRSLTVVVQGTAS